MDRWGYDDRLILATTHGEPGDAVRPTGRAVSGPIDKMTSEAKEAGGGKEVYMDGGDLTRQGAEAEFRTHRKARPRPLHPAPNLPSTLSRDSE